MISKHFCVWIFLFFIIAAPFPLWMYYSLIFYLAPLFCAITHLVLKTFGFYFVQPVSIKTFILFGFIKLSIALCLCKFLLPDGIPCAFKKPIWIELLFYDPPFNFGFRYTVLKTRLSMYILEMSFPNWSFIRKQLAFGIIFLICLFSITLI